MIAQYFIRLSIFSLSKIRVYPNILSKYFIQSEKFYPFEFIQVYPKIILSIFYPNILSKILSILGILSKISLSKISETMPTPPYPHAKMMKNQVFLCKIENLKNFGCWKSGVLQLRKEWFIRKSPFVPILNKGRLSYKPPARRRLTFLGMWRHRDYTVKCAVRELVSMFY